MPREDKTLKLIEIFIWLVARAPRLLPGLFVLLKWLFGQSERTGFYMAGSKPLAVCNNRRLHSNRVFDGVAARGTSSMGWFYGLKAHLVINGTGHPTTRAVGQLRHHARPERAVFRRPGISDGTVR